MNRISSRRRFLITAGAAGSAVIAGEPARDNLHLGMMLQGASAEILLKQAGSIAGAGFDTVQLTFFFEPAADELKALAETLGKLRLKVAALGTYCNLLRPDDAGFMGCSVRTMKLLAQHAGLFGCRQFVSWSGSYAPKFAGTDPRNHSPEAVSDLQRAIREVILPVLEPVDGRLAFEPYYRHVLGTVDLAKQIFAPFSAERIGLVLDPPNFISPELYSKREEEMRRSFRELGDRVHLVHFKDLKQHPDGTRVDLPGPGGGEQNYPLFVSELRQLRRPLTCVIEHIKAEPEVMAKTKAWVEARLSQK